MSAKTELHIIMPGACGPLAEVRTLQDNPVIHNWVALLSKVVCYPSPTNLHEIVAELFGLSFAQDFPSAALTLLANDRYDDSYNYMHADPVHLRAELDHAVLTASQDLAIQEHESDILCDVLNQHFDQDGLHFFRLNNDQWYVSSQHKIRLKTTSLADATGRNINFLLPRGEDSKRWKQLLTEAQMLLHAHEVNTRRENAARPTINSLWFHGCGELPQYGPAEIGSVCSDQDMFAGLSKYIKKDFLKKPDSVDEYVTYLLKHGADSVNVLHLSELEHLVNYTDVTIWLEKLTALLDHWIYPLIKIANKNNIKIMLYPVNEKKYQFSKYDALKFWKKGSIDNHIACHRSHVQ